MGIFDRLTGGRVPPRTGSDPADLVLYNGRILTCDSRNRTAQALAVKDGRFVFVGSRDGIADHVGPETELLDARNRVVTPGFIDSHCHILWVGALEPLLSQEHYNCSTFDEMAVALRRHADANPDLPFVFCMGWNHDKVPGGAPTAGMLDEVIRDRPVILWSDSAHCGWVNTMALELMQERNPSAFEQLLPVKDESGRPTGEFLTFWFIEPSYFFSEDELGGDLKERMLSGMRNAIDMALSVGVTGYDDVMVHRTFIPLILEFKKRGGFEMSRCRGTFYINHHMPGEMDELASFLEYWKGLDSESDEHIVLGRSVKMGTDGVSPNHTSYMLEPYSDRPGYRGEASWDKEDFINVVKLAHSMGLQVCTHACGDAAIREAIDGYETVAGGGRLSLPHRVDHCSLPTAEDQLRMASLGISAAMQPAHFWGSETGAKALGAERMNRTMPFKSMQDRGVHLSFGSDWCAGPINPMYGLLLAATRMNYRMKTEWGPQEKIGVEDGIRHWTMGSAEDLMIEAAAGSIEAGKHADFVVFNTNPLKLGTWWFMLTHKLELGAMDGFVDLTYVGGKPVYRKPQGRRRT